MLHAFNVFGNALTQSNECDYVWIVYVDKLLNPLIFVTLTCEWATTLYFIQYWILLWYPISIGEGNECQRGRWAPKGGGLWDPTSVGEENEAFFIRTWKPLPSRRSLKTLRGSLKGKARKKQYPPTAVTFILVISYIYAQNVELLIKPLKLPPILSRTIIDEFAAVGVLQVIYNFLFFFGLSLSIILTRLAGKMQIQFSQCKKCILKYQLKLQCIDSEVVYPRVAWIILTEDRNWKRGKANKMNCTG